jgi:undecaprenyl-diphosphatase
VFGSGVYKLKDIGGPGEATAWGPTILATVIAFLVGLVVIAWLMRFIKTRSYAPFVAYRIGMGVLLIILVTSGALDPSAGHFASK